MIKLLFLFLLVFWSLNLFSQSTASAVVSATVLTPVGAEISGDMNFSGSVVNPGNAIFASYKSQTDNLGLSLKNQTAISYVKIIGGSFVYDVTLQTEPVSLLEKNGNVLTINVFKMPVRMQTSDIADLPIVARVKGNFLGKENFTAPYLITINFN